MRAISKFLFDTSFDAHRADEPPAPPPRRNFTPSELEAARAAAHADGVSAGRDAAMQSIEAHQAETLAAIGRQLGTVAVAAGASATHRSKEFLAAMGAIARKLIPGLVERHGLAEVEALVSDCLARLHDEPRVVVRVHDSLLDPLRERIDGLAGAAGFGGRVIALADPQVAAGDARIEWADGGAERDSSRSWAEIEAQIAHFIETWPHGQNTSAKGPS